jgi:hypothetical protein
MKTSNETTILQENIFLLKEKQKREFSAINEQFSTVYESLNPMKLIKSTVSELIETPDIKHKFMNSIIGLATGFISKKLIIGSTHNPVRKILGTVLQFVITNYVSKHSESITNKL